MPILDKKKSWKSVIYISFLKCWEKRKLGQRTHKKGNKDKSRKNEIGGKCIIEKKFKKHNLYFLEKTNKFIATLLKRKALTIELFMKKNITTDLIHITS